jgi:hypothetical protein
MEEVVRWELDENPLLREPFDEEKAVDGEVRQPRPRRGSPDPRPHPGSICW